MDCPWQWQANPQVALFLAWGSSYWVGGQWHLAHVVPRSSCPTFAMLLLLEPTSGVIFQVPAPAHWLLLSLCRTEMQENVCGEYVRGGACVPASLSTPYPKMCLKPSPYPAALPSPWASADLHVAAWGDQRLMTVLVSGMDL